MPSLFPGMDPFLEDFVWPDFHTNLAVFLRSYIAKRLPAELVVTIEVTAITENLTFKPSKKYRLDVSINKRDESGTGGTQSVEEPGGDLDVATTPDIKVVRKIEVETSQKTLVIRKLGNKKLIGAVEILSPANKRGDNLIAYRKKRADYLSHGVHLLELDLLREGTRPVYDYEWPHRIYYVQLEDVHAEELSVWSLNLSNALPRLHFPLLEGSDPMLIDLQAVFDQTYEMADYARQLNYHLPLKPPLRHKADRDFLSTIELLQTS